MGDNNGESDVFVGMRRFQPEGLEDRIINAGEERVFEAVGRANNVFDKTTDGILDIQLCDGGFDPNKYGIRNIGYLLERYEEILDIEEHISNRQVINYAADLMMKRLQTQFSALNELRSKYTEELSEHMRFLDESSGFDPSTRRFARTYAFGIGRLDYFIDAISKFMKRIGKEPTPTPAASAPDAPSDGGLALAEADGAAVLGSEPASAVQTPPPAAIPAPTTVDGSLEYTLEGLPTDTREPTYYFKIQVGDKTEKAYTISELASMIGTVPEAIRSSMKRRTDAVEKLTEDGLITYVKLSESLPTLPRRGYAAMVIAGSCLDQILSEAAASKFKKAIDTNVFNLQEVPVKYDMCDASREEKSAGTGQEAGASDNAAAGKAEEQADLKQGYTLNPPCFTDRVIGKSTTRTIEYVALQLGDKVVVYWPTSSIEDVLENRTFSDKVYERGMVSITAANQLKAGKFEAGQLLTVGMRSQSSRPIKFLIRSDGLEVAIPKYITSNCKGDAFEYLSKGFKYAPMDEDRIDIEVLEAQLKEYKLMPEDAHLSLNGTELYSFEQLAEKKMFADKGYGVADIATRTANLVTAGTLTLKPIDEELGEAGPVGIMKSDVLTLYWSLREQQSP